MIEVTRFDAAKSYDAKNHFAITAMRLQGQGVSRLMDYWFEFSKFLSGGGADRGAAATGKVYALLEGEITVTTDEGDSVLGKFDSCYLPPGTGRSVINATNHSVQMLVFSPNRPWIGGNS